jgi:DNA-binding transcriptional ArsR family regulator
MPSDDVLWVTRPEHIRALASPMRQRILDRLEAIGPCSVRALASSLGAAPDSLYYHVRQLEQIGLLVVGRRRQAGRRSQEAVLSLKSPKWRIAYAPGDPRTASAVLKVGRTILRQAQRDFAQGLRHPRALTRGPLRNLWSLRLEGSLKPGEVRRINAHLGAILKILRRGGHDPREGLLAVSWVLAPIDPLGGQRRSGVAPAANKRRT